MFEQFFSSMQQDVQLCLFFPFLCAVFRAIFIALYNPYKNLAGRWKVVMNCFRYGFWWGMDFNAYAFLLPLILISLPGVWIASYGAIGDEVRLAAGMVYATVLYAAFMGKVIFYTHFHDTYNHILRLGMKAEKRNLVDTFFHQDHGLWWLLGLVPFWFVSYEVIMGLLAIPNIPYPAFSAAPAQYGFNTVVFLGAIAMFYWFRYGGHFSHDDKPQWDNMPSLVKTDTFFAKAAVDDLVALERVKKRKLDDVYIHTDEDDKKAIQAIVPEGRHVQDYENPLYAFQRHAKGAKIRKPSHIFLFVGESYLQQYFDPAFASLGLTQGGAQWMNDAHTAVLRNALSAGVISRPTIVSLMSGIFDDELQLNENERFWQGTVPTSLPVQLRKLGYTSTYWYGGNVTYGNFNHFAKASGFDHVRSATDFCGPDAPKTWVGVYDGVYLDKAAELIQHEDTGTPAFHMIYTTSYHSPFKIPVRKYGYDTERVMPNGPADIKENKRLQEILGTFWYADQAASRFLNTMRQAYPDALFIITGDHAIPLTYLEQTSLMGRPCSIRERHSPVFMVHHRDIDQAILAGNTIGGHMNILPTIMELIAPKGFTYYSLCSSLTEPLDHVTTPRHWLRPDGYGSFDSTTYQPLGTGYDESSRLDGPIPYEAERQAYRSLTGYFLRHPELLRPATHF